MSKGDQTATTTIIGTAGGGSPKQVTPAAIAQRAYELFLRRGGGAGDELGDWLQAEVELTALARDQVAAEAQETGEVTAETTLEGETAATEPGSSGPAIRRGAGRERGGNRRGARPQTSH